MELLLIGIYIYLSLAGIISLVNAVVFCFWLAYLVNSSIYRRKLLRLSFQQERENSQNLPSYNNKTFIVRDVFLLAILVTEVLGGLFYVISYVYASVQNGNECVERDNNETLLLKQIKISDLSCFMNNFEIQSLNSKLNHSLVLLTYSCLSLCQFSL